MCGELSGQVRGPVAWPEPRRRRAQAAARAGELGAVHTMRGSENGEGEEEQKLTVVKAEGQHCLADEVDLRRWQSRATLVRRLQGEQRSGLGLLEEVDDGEAPGHDGATRRRWWLRLCQRRGRGCVGHGGREQGEEQGEK